MLNLNVSAIQRFSVDDGPGIRTTVFLKGCNLRCAWCHNPETIGQQTILQYTAVSCTKCGRCEQACPEGVHRIANGEHQIDWSRCKCCGKCCTACLNRALKLVGQEMQVEALLDILLRDSAYYETSGGGVTFSGGEPMLQHEALAQVLRRCKEAGLHTAVDTAGAVPYAYFEEVLPYTDLFLFDLKCFSDALHRTCTGVGNERILSNVQRLGQAGAALFLRTPLVKGMNADLDELRALADFAAGLKGVQNYKLLPYHNYGIGKYATVGLPTPKEFAPPDETELNAILNVFLNRGLPAELG